GALRRPGADAGRAGVVVARVAPGARSAVGLVRPSHTASGRGIACAARRAVGAGAGDHRAAGAPAVSIAGVDPRAEVPVVARGPVGVERVVAGGGVGAGGDARAGGLVALAGRRRTGDARSRRAAARLARVVPGAPVLVGVARRAVGERMIRAEAGGAVARAARVPRSARPAPPTLS